MKTQRLFLPGILLCILSLGIFARCSTRSTLVRIKNDAFIDSIHQKLMAYRTTRAPEKIYLHTDKPLYEPGEEIWFSGYLRGYGNTTAGYLSDKVYIELLNPQGNPVGNQSLFVVKGKFHSRFVLDEGIAGGMYKIKAYTSWMQKADRGGYFEKAVQVQSIIKPRLLLTLDFKREAYGAGDQVEATLKARDLKDMPIVGQSIAYTLKLAGKTYHQGKAITNGKGKANIKVKLPEKLKSNDGLLQVLVAHKGTTESVSRSVPIVLGNIALDFFPEGGNWVADIKSKMAFKALNEFGKPADIEGAVVSESGKIMQTFTSYHQGLGAFTMLPAKGEKYQVKITKPAGITKTYPLPLAEASQYALSVEQPTRNQLKVQVFSPAKTRLYLVVQSGSQVLYSQKVKAEGMRTRLIPVKNFPAGIHKVSLFDAQKRVRCERLVFINPHKQLKVQIKTNQKSYQPRHKVTADILTTNEKGEPVPANLSVAVVDDKLLTMANDKQDNILSALLMSTELKGKVYEPNFYFKPDEPKARPALDYVMLTHGWRKYEWAKVLGGHPKTVNKEQASVAVGQILQRVPGAKPVTVAGAKVVLYELGSKTRKQETVTDKNGRFIFRNIAPNVPAQVVTWYTQNKVRFIKMDGIRTRMPEFTNVYQRKAVKVNDLLLDPVLIKEVNELEEIEQPEVIEVPDEDEIEVMLDIEFEEEVPPPPLPPLLVPGYKVNGERYYGFWDIEGIKLDNIQAIKYNKSSKEIEITTNIKTKVNETGKNRQVLRMYHLSAMSYPSPVIYTPKVYAAKEQEPKVRTDFRNTIYWNPEVQTDKNGKATITFWNNDALTTFRIIAEGVGQNRQVGRAEHTYFSKLPFELTAKVPPYFSVNDVLKLPVYLTNNTPEAIEGTLEVGVSEAFEIDQRLLNIKVPPYTTQTVHVAGKVLSKLGKKTKKQLIIKFKSPLYAESYSQKVKVFGKGFPRKASYSSNGHTNRFRINLPKMLDNSLEVELVAYPNIIGDLMDGIASVLRRPYGCFEQVSSSTYPNILALQFLEKTGAAKPKFKAIALDYIAAGYKKLAAYETSEHGFEWYGDTPPHEGLSAFGLLEFMAMKQVYPAVSEAMLARTKTWLLSRRDGKGGFKRNAGKYGFAGASAAVTNAYVVYALSEAGEKDIIKEYNTAYAEALKSRDAYRMALLCLAAINLNKPRQALQLHTALRLQVQRLKPGKLQADHSLVRSYGKSLQIETAALIALVEMCQPKPSVTYLQPLLNYIISQRNGGYFGSTQGTILALQALTKYAVLQSKQARNGRVLVYKGKEQIASLKYSGSQLNVAKIEGLEKYLKEGVQEVSVRFSDKKEAIPFSLNVRYQTLTPDSSPQCKVDLSTHLSAKEVTVNETVRLTTVIKNKKANGQPSTVALVGIPSGLSPQPWQLKELQEKNKVAFYEIHGSYIVFYFRDLAPSAVKTIHLDLKADVPGTYHAPAGSAYLYYTSEHKDWETGEKIVIKEAVTE